MNADTITNPTEQATTTGRPLRELLAGKATGTKAAQPLPKDLRALAENGNGEAIRTLAAAAVPIAEIANAKDSAEPWVSYRTVNERLEREIDWPAYFAAAKIDLGATRGMDSDEIRDTLPPPVVAGIVRRGSVMLLAGASKARKSWLALALALAVRTGGNFIGFPTVQARVRYLDFELKERTGASRYALARLGLTDDEALQEEIDSDFFYHSMRCHPTEEGRLAGVGAWMKAEAKAGELWILDCLQPVLEVDQNDSLAIRRELSPLLAATAQTGAVLCIIDHYNKSSDSRGMNRVSGSVAKVASVDSIVTLSPKDGFIHIDFDLREDPPVEGAVVVQFNSSTHGFDVVNADDAKRVDEQVQRERLAEWLATGWDDGSTPKTRADLAASWKMLASSGALRQRITALVASGAIREGKQGNRCIYELATGHRGKLWQDEASQPESFTGEGMEVATGS